jgi:chromosome segregation ATPase
MERRWTRLDRAGTAVSALERELLSLQQNMTAYEGNISTLERRISEYTAAKPGASADRDRATSALRNAQARSAKLDGTQYDKGDPTKIQAAQAVVDRIAAHLASYREAYTAGMKAPTERTAKEQATFDAAMAPFHQAVADSETAKAHAVANAQKEVDAAQQKVDQGGADLGKLKTGVSGWKRFWWAWPKWLFGSGFSVSKFWKDRPAA